jgi:hypothetical protein
MADLLAIGHAIRDARASSVSVETVGFGAGRDAAQGE